MGIFSTIDLLLILLDREGSGFIGKGDLFLMGWDERWPFKRYKRPPNLVAENIPHLRSLSFASPKKGKA